MFKRWSCRHHSCRFPGEVRDICGYSRFFGGGFESLCILKCSKRTNVHHNLPSAVQLFIVFIALWGTTCLECRLLPNHAYTFTYPHCKEHDSGQCNDSLHIKREKNSELYDFSDAYALVLQRSIPLVLSFIENLTWCSSWCVIFLDRWNCRARPVWKRITQNLFWLCFLNC